MKKSLVFFLFLSCTSFSFGQKTMSLSECENLFQKNNLLLLAEQYNIDASKAAVIQAKIWEHPVVTTEVNFYNPNENRFFNAGKNGQKQLAIEQLIYLGGKKRNEINFAKNNVALAELQYEQLVRNLALQTRQNFYELYFEYQKFKSIETQLNYLENLVAAYKTQTDKGNIALKDLVRLQSLLLAFKNDMLEINKQILEKRENLKILTATSEDFLPTLNEQELKEKLNKPILYLETKLQEIALEKNPEYRFNLKLIENNELYIKWQKSLATPDITLGASYDQRGGAFNNQTNLTLAIPLPLWNKNKGNIKIAQTELQQNKKLKEQKELELKAKVTTAIQTYNFHQKQYKESESSIHDFETVNQGILNNFQKKNISLIEFTDFMESYNQSTLYLNQIKKELILSGENLNYITNDFIY
ncbi:TolC family protein [Flavobacterium sp. HNIBRBA15423]|uniref:TolC family protein n=1 Tax=Flavobacterium sp. HNIBRBA15423 TaxID=3458683 RepID=UPI004044A601